VQADPVEQAIPSESKRRSNESLSVFGNLIFRIPGSLSPGPPFKTASGISFLIVSSKDSLKAET
jgi:hypothetical protein